MLQCINLTKSFEGHSVLHEFCHDFAPGITAIVGKNGCGKSTLLNLMSGFLQLDNGTIKWEDKVINSLDPLSIVRIGISRTFQDGRVVGDLRVWEHVSLGLKARRGQNLISSLNLSWKGAPENAVHNNVEQLLNSFKLNSLSDRFVSSLSIGQKRLVSIATCAATDASCFLLDEPIAGVDAHHIELLLAWIKHIEYLGKVVIVVEHNLPFVDRLTSKVIVLGE